MALEYVCARNVAAGALLQIFDFDFAQAAAFIIQQPAKHRFAIEDRRAEPIYGTAAANQRGSYFVSDNCVFRNRVLRCLCSHATLDAIFC